MTSLPPSDSHHPSSDTPVAESFGASGDSAFQGRELLLGVCGGVAAYKVAMVCSQLVQAGVSVQVVMTRSAQQFIGPATFEALTGRAVITQAFDAQHPLGPHITLARQAELFCIAPATANLMAKAAHGIADDLLSTLLLSFTGPVVMAPAMNCEMWEKPALQRNVQQLVEDGIHLVGPDEGWLSCRQRGRGRLADPGEIVAAITQQLSSRAT